MGEGTADESFSVVYISGVPTCDADIDSKAGVGMEDVCAVAMTTKEGVKNWEGDNTETQNI